MYLHRYVGIDIMATGLLKMLMLHVMTEGEASGYDIIKKVESLTGKKPSTGSIYPLLKKMEREGWISGRAEDGKTYYSLTEIGKEHTAQIKETKHDFIKNIYQSIVLANETFDDDDLRAFMKDMHDFHRGSRAISGEEMRLIEPLITEIAELLKRDVDREKIESVLSTTVNELQNLVKGGTVTNKNHCGCKDLGQKGQRRGRSSFWMHDPEVIFDALSLKEGDCFLDMGCGPGDYTIRASKIVGDSGAVYALDRWQDVIDDLSEKANSQGLRNIRAIASDITKQLPIKDECIDVCFMSTVLHSLDLADVEKNLFGEIRRVLKPGGRVAIIECKKEEQHFGPPIHMRLSPEQIEGSIMRYGFEKIGLVDLGYNYMIIFNKN